MLKSAERERQRDEVGEGADLCEREGERVDTDLCEREGERVDTDLIWRVAIKF